MIIFYILQNTSLMFVNIIKIAVWVNVRNVCLPVWHSAPVKPHSHAQKYPSNSSVHVPPFSHGSLLHSLMSKKSLSCYKEKLNVKIGSWFHKLSLDDYKLNFNTCLTFHSSEARYTVTNISIYFVCACAAILTWITAALIDVFKKRLV